MLITIENFGAIKYFQFDTEKDLYLIFGKNSVGKSYAISLVYLILKHICKLNSFFSRSKRGIFFLGINNFDIDFRGAFDDDKKNLELINKSSNNEKLNLLNYVYEKYVDNEILFLLKEFVKLLNNSIENTFSSLNNLQNRFSTEKEALKISIQWRSYLDMTINIELNESNDHSMRFIITEYYCNKEAFLSTLEDHPFNLDNFSGIESCFNTIFSNIAHKLECELEDIKNVYYLPASRSGTYQALSSFSQILVELSKNRNTLSNQTFSIPFISEPTADFFNHLSNINILEPESAYNSDYIGYASEIEKEILQGSVGFDDTTKQLFFSPNKTNLKLSLSSASSMVSELSVIVSYLKYIINFTNKKPLIFIEEPEAHLHPETQVKLMAVFARLVKDNKIKLVMTSHSNYIFNKASNLVIDNKIDKEKFEAILFESTPEGSVARNLDTDEYGIEDDNFIDTAESIYEEKLELINKLNG